jgi:alkanesulfonate monooxygenase SsuD/methylene tetrahydromethanopterin reductase-like flavin-dependent oxidoreductase (luciferase family)
MTFELGVYSFGNTPRTADGEYATTAQAIRDVLEAARLADDVGLDTFPIFDLDVANYVFTTGAAEIGRPGLAPTGRDADYEPGGMVFAGRPNEVADRILHLHSLLGHTRQILQMDVGGMPHATFLKAIELLGTDVLRQIRKELE